MLDNEPQNGPAEAATNSGTSATADENSIPARRTTRRRPAAKAPASAESAPAKTGAPDTPALAPSDETEARPARSRARKAAKAIPGTATDAAPPAETATSPAETTSPAARATRRRRPTVAETEQTMAETGQTSTETGQTALEFDVSSDTPAPAGSSDTTPGAVDSSEATEPPARSRRRRSTAAPFSVDEQASGPATAPVEPETSRPGRAPVAALFVAPVIDEPPSRSTAPAAEPAASDEGAAPRSTSSRRRTRRTPDEPAPEPTETPDAADDEDDEEFPGESAAARRRRRRGRRGRGRGKGPHDDVDGDDEETPSDAADDDVAEEGGDGVTRRRRKRRRRGAGSGEESETDDGVVTVVKIREPRPPRDEVQGVTGSTRLEAKRQRRRDGRDQRRTRPAILSESEFLARREAVDRVMAIRQKGDRTQIAVLEDGVLVEHYVTRASSGTMVGNVYLGKVQNVLPSMEAAFVDIGRGRNAVLYAGEVNWDMAGLEGRARSIEQALKAGDPVLVQVTKDPIGHKGARLTSHVALSGRHLVYVPNGNTSGISRKLSDVERKRLRDVLKKLIPEGAGVIVRTAAEGASEDELSRDVTRLQAQWVDIESKVAAGSAPVQLYEEPDLVIRVVRDLFNEDFRELVVQGADAYDMVDSYLSHVSPDLVERLRRHTGTQDVFATYRIDEQILKGLDRKVFLPSGGSLVIDRTEAMTVIDVNTGKYTGTGGNLEETVTRNNLEAAEEIVRQLRLRDLGGIIVIDFIDMVLESNRELVLRRLTECLGRDRTKHQVTEITSLGLVQMTRKRIGQGLLEAFSETCEHCKGRGVIIHLDPVPERKLADHGGHRESLARDTAPHREPAAAGEPTGRRRGRRGRGVGADEPAAEATDSTAGETAEAQSGADESFDGETVAATVPPPATTNGYAAAVPPPPSGWVNLAAAPPRGSDAVVGASPSPEPAAAAATGTDLEPVSDFAQTALPEVEALESESAEPAGRRRGSRWRLRP
jgi:ribonuclease E